VLEFTPPTGWQQRWCSRLGLSEETFRTLLADANRAGALGNIDLEQYTATSRTARPRRRADGRLHGRHLARVPRHTQHRTHQLLHRASAADAHRGILSNSFVGAREREQERYGFEDCCDVVAYSHEIGVMKPDPTAYTTVCDLLEVEPREAVFLDDLEMCVEGAEAVRMKAVLFRNNEQAITEIEAHLNETADVL
jgi:HAD superfamily hydrolase (TIGR01509 family)